MLGNRAKEKCDFRTVPTVAMFELMKKSMSGVHSNRPTIEEMFSEVKSRILAIDPADPHVPRLDYDKSSVIFRNDASLRRTLSL